MVSEFLMQINYQSSTVIEIEENKINVIKYTWRLFILLIVKIEATVRLQRDLQLQL